MKVYTLKIVYDEVKEEIEYISEELEGDVKGILEGLSEDAGVVVDGNLDEEDIGFVEGCHIIGEA